MNLRILLLIVFLIILQSISMQYFLRLDKLLYNFYSEQFTQEQIEKIVFSQQKWKWLGCAILPLLVFIRNSLADRIYVLENGMITSSGNHQKLLETSNFYSEFWEEIVV